MHRPRGHGQLQRFALHQIIDMFPQSRNKSISMKLLGVGENFFFWGHEGFLVVFKFFNGMGEGWGR